MGLVVSRSITNTTLVFTSGRYRNLHLFLFTKRASGITPSFTTSLTHSLRGFNTDFELDALRFARLSRDSLSETGPSLPSQCFTNARERRRQQDARALISTRAHARSRMTKRGARFSSGGVVAGSCNEQTTHPENRIKTRFRRGESMRPFAGACVPCVPRRACVCECVAAFGDIDHAVAVSVVTACACARATHATLLSSH